MSSSETKGKALAATVDGMSLSDLADAIVEAIRMATAPLHTRLLHVEAELSTAKSTIVGLQKAPYEHLGLYEPTREYQKNQMVIRHGHWWCSMTNGNLGVEPGTDPAWSMCVQRGKEGKQGKSWKDEQ